MDDEIPSLQFGGAERVVSLLSKNFPVRTCICLFKKKIDYLVDSEVYVIGEPLGVTNRLRSYINYLTFLRVYRPYAVVSLLNKAHTLNLLVGIRNRKFLWIQNYPIRLYMKHRIYKLINDTKHKSFFRLADGVIAPSRGLAEKLVNGYRIPHHKVSVVPNPIDISLIRAMASEKLSEEEERFFGEPTLINKEAI